MDNTPDTVTPAKECPHYILTRDAEAGRTLCRGCEQKLDKVISNLVARVEEVFGPLTRQAA